MIGEKLPVKRVTAGVPEALDRLDEKNWKDAATGILTTDTRPKLLSKQIKWQARGDYYWIRERVWNDT